MYNNFYNIFFSVFLNASITAVHYLCIKKKNNKILKKKIFEILGYVWTFILPCMLVSRTYILYQAL